MSGVDDFVDLAIRLFVIEVVDLLIVGVPQVSLPTHVSGPAPCHWISSVAGKAATAAPGFTKPNEPQYTYDTSLGGLR